MIVKKFISNVLNTNCYVVKFKKSAIIIDPCVSYEIIASELEGFDVKGIFLTHGHADHFIHIGGIKENYDCKIYLHRNAKEKLEDSYKNCSQMFHRNITFKFNNSDYEYIYEGCVIPFDNQKVKLIETPGHSDCSVCLIIGDSMFTGDTLFDRTVGRTDIFSSNAYELQISLKKIKAITKDLKIYPGHGNQSTLFKQFESNKHLQKL